MRIVWEVALPKTFDWWGGGAEGVPVSLLIKIGKSRSKHFERPFVWARERKEVRGRDRMRQMILKEISV